MTDPNGSSEDELLAGRDPGRSGARRAVRASVLLVTNDERRATHLADWLRSVATTTWEKSMSSGQRRLHEHGAFDVVVLDHAAALEDVLAHVTGDLASWSSCASLLVLVGDPGQEVELSRDEDCAISYRSDADEVTLFEDDGCAVSFDVAPLEELTLHEDDQCVVTCRAEPIGDVELVPWIQRAIIETRGPATARPAELAV